MTLAVALVVAGLVLLVYGVGVAVGLYAALMDLAEYAEKEDTLTT